MNEIRKRLALALLLAIIIAGILTGINFITAKNGDPLLAKKYPGDNLTEWKGFGLYRVEFHNETVKDEDGQIRPLTRTEFDYESFLKILVILSLSRRWYCQCWCVERWVKAKRRTDSSHKRIEYIHRRKRSRRRGRFLIGRMIYHVPRIGGNLIGFISR